MLLALVAEQLPTQPRVKLEFKTLLQQQPLFMDREVVTQGVLLRDTIKYSRSASAHQDLAADGGRKKVSLPADWAPECLGTEAATVEQLKKRLHRVSCDKLSSQCL